MARMKNVQPGSNKARAIEAKQVRLMVVILGGATRTEAVSFGNKQGLTGDQVAAITSHAYTLNGKNEVAIPKTPVSALKDAEFDFSDLEVAW